MRHRAERRRHYRYPPSLILMTGLLAHGGTGGALVETAVLLVPLAAFALMARSAHRREAKGPNPADENGSVGAPS